MIISLLNSEVFLKNLSRNYVVAITPSQGWKKVNGRRLSCMVTTFPSLTVRKSIRIINRIWCLHSTKPPLKYIYIEYSSYWARRILSATIETSHIRIIASAKTALVVFFSMLAKFTQTAKWYLRAQLAHIEESASNNMYNNYSEKRMRKTRTHHFFSSFNLVNEQKFPLEGNLLALSFFFSFFLFSPFFLWYIREFVAVTCYAANVIRLTGSDIWQKET